MGSVLARLEEDREIVDRFDQPVVYMNAADYTAWAKKTYEAERKTIERLGLVGTI